MFVSNVDYFKLSNYNSMYLVCRLFYFYKKTINTIAKNKKIYEFSIVKTVANNKYYNKLRVLKYYLV